eukprot:748020-Hanusia_phi.AAC.4
MACEKSSIVINRSRSQIRQTFEISRRPRIDAELLQPTGRGRTTRAACKVSQQECNEQQRSLKHCSCFAPLSPLSSSASPLVIP